jgi:hypothetical protein
VGEKHHDPNGRVRETRPDRDFRISQEEMERLADFRAHLNAEAAGAIERITAAAKHSLLTFADIQSEFASETAAKMKEGVKRLLEANGSADGGAAEPLPPPPSEPLVAEWLMSLLCKRDVREAVLGDLAERFQERAELDGLRSAQLWYWRQLARSFGRFAWSWLVRVAELHSLLRLIGL